MSLPDQTPKLPKLPFLIGDAALLAAAGFIAAQARHPLPIEQTLAIVGCIVVGGLIGVIPFLTDYARRQDEALDDRQRGLEALARTVASSAEQIGIAAQGLQEITALVQRSLQDVEQLPGKLQERMAEVPPPLEAGRSAERQMADRALAAALAEKADRLEAVAEQIAKGAADWAKADAAFQKMVATLGEAPARAAASPPPEASAPPAEFAAPPSLALDIPPPVAVSRSPRKPRKPKAEVAPEPRAPETEAAVAPMAAASAPSEFSQAFPDEAAPTAAVSTDGATRLLVTAYIGIGNRIFIRGDGPGLSWEKGVPLEFVSIGKWRWETADASAPIRFKLYKNDEVECVGLGEGALEAGRQQELTAAF